MKAKEYDKLSADNKRFREELTEVAGYLRESGKIGRAAQIETVLGGGR